VLVSVDFVVSSRITFEPGSLALFGSGVIGLMAMLRRKLNMLATSFPWIHSRSDDLRLFFWSKSLAK
jgi:hypothetical protein